MHFFWEFITLAVEAKNGQGYLHFFSYFWAIFGDFSKFCSDFAACSTLNNQQKRPKKPLINGPKNRNSDTSRLTDSITILKAAVFDIITYLAQFLLLSTRQTRFIVDNFMFSRCNSIRTNFSVSYNGRWASITTGSSPNKV